MRTKRLLFVLLLCLLLLGGCGSEEAAAPTVAPTAVAVVAATEIPPTEVSPTEVPPTEVPPTEVPPTEVPPTEVPPDPNAALSMALQGIVEKWAADQRYPSAMLLVDLPARDFYWKGAAGVRDWESNDPVEADDPFALASVTKSFTAATILRLAEEGLLSIDDLIADYLDPTIVAEINVYDGVSYGPQITIRQLLNHTAGVGDHGFYDVDENGVSDFNEMLLANPDQSIRAPEVVAWTIANVPAVGPPGEQWVYSSTGYLLLGMIIEEVTGATLAEAYHTFVLDPLALDHTWLDYYEPPPAGVQSISHPYANDVDVANLEVRSSGWSEGGLYSTLDDQARFWRALLVDNTVFAEPGTLELMEEWVTAIPGAADYGLGLIRYDLDAIGMEGLPPVLCHAGIYNNLSVYVPEMDAVVIFTLNADTDFRTYFPFVAEVLYTLQAVTADA